MLGESDRAVSSIFRDLQTSQNMPVSENCGTLMTIAVPFKKQLNIASNMDDNLGFAMNPESPKVWFTPTIM